MAQNIVTCKCGKIVTAMQYLRHLKPFINHFSQIPLRNQIKQHRIVTFDATNSAFKIFTEVR